MSGITKLHQLRRLSKEIQTVGLSDEVIKDFLEKDPRLESAIDEAFDFYQQHLKDLSSILSKSERDQITEIQENFLNFYSPDAVNPYISLAAQGPWIVTSCGAVIYDAGGYGMLGLGHAPNGLGAVLAQPFVMANIMTANFWQKKFTDLLLAEIGHTRPSRYGLFKKFLCLNSGSEAMTVAARISDIHAKLRAGSRKIRFLALKGSFHGRTDRPAQVSDSSLSGYRKHLASFSRESNLSTVEPNNLHQLQRVFDEARQEGIFYEAMFLEPVMGEGDPGKAITREFYNLARKLTAETGTLLIVDSIQAGLRSHGVLSIVDYPGFQDADAPDMESYSKALNAGQYPLSVLAMTQKMADLYVTGLYGNTMTTNPRALAVGAFVLEHLSDKLRLNIKQRGQEALEKFASLQNRYPHIITNVQGTGLLFSMAINPQAYDVLGANGLETYLRKQGLGVIHGGTNCLRFTPNFQMSTHEVDLMISLLEKSFSAKNLQKTRLAS